MCNERIVIKDLKTKTLKKFAARLGLQIINVNDRHTLRIPIEGQVIYLVSKPEVKRNEPCSTGTNHIR